MRATPSIAHLRSGNSGTRAAALGSRRCRASFALFPNLSPGPQRHSQAAGPVVEEIGHQEYGGLKLDQARRLKELERENGRLKRAVAELTLDKLILKEAAEGNF